MGIDESQPRFSWRLESTRRNVTQTAWQVVAASTRQNVTNNKGDLWDSGRITGRQANQIVYAGQRLASRQQVFWKVRVWDNENKPSAWSQPASFSMGLLQPTDWQGQWISYKDTTPLHTSRQSLYLPAPRYYRKQTRVVKPIRRAMLYASALGIYDAYINGRRVSDRMFSPGWSDYLKRAYYNSFDVTSLMTPGDNAIAAVVAEGWYSGYVGYGLLVGYGPHKAGRAFYGKTPALLAQLEIEYSDGTRDILPTNSSWKVSTGGLKEADLLMGETHDARLEPENWNRPAFDDAGWPGAIQAVENGSIKAPFFDRSGERQVELGFLRPMKLQAYSGPPVRPIEEVRPKTITTPKPGTHIFHLGQNIAGVIRLKARGPAGTRIQIRYAEMLHADGTLMTENLRRARATDSFILKGTGQDEAFTPRFTYHGFQYVELTGFPGTPTLDAVTGIVVHSDTPLVSSFRSSDEMANQLFKNIVWTQRANFVELPTDCPQRDERLAWTGDAQAYARTASYNADVASFFTKWLDDLEEAQRPNGAFPDYAPYPMQHGAVGSYGTAWMDAGIIVPHTIWRVYNDKRVIERHWAAMTRFMDFRREASPEFRGIAHGNPWGDWLSINSETPLVYIDAAYFALTARLMAEMAAATNQAHEESRYRTLFKNVRERFMKDYLLPDGRLKVRTQTAYALALYADLIPANLREASAKHLAALVGSDGNRMTTGFLGTKPLIPMLSATGQNDLAVRLFLSREFPSWGYEIANGATTIWERWNSYTKDKGFFSPEMNSFSHYSFGAIGQWMFETLAGIDTDTAGFQRLNIRPHPPAQQPLTMVDATYNSINGPIASRWERTAGRVNFRVSIPANTTAVVWLPAGTQGDVLNAAGARFLRLENGRALYEIGSGAYDFAVAAK
jgi:alpha-L-rhamnosidase